VICAWIVEIDGLLHEAQAQRLAVEINIALRIRRDERDVVQALNGHLGSSNDNSESLQDTTRA
jgi:hypothetical protein